MRWLLLFLLLIPFASSYAGFTDATSLSVVDNVVTANDDAIYYQGWYSANNQNWESFTFPDAQTSGWILDGSATKILPDVFTAGGEHYILIYSCSKGSWSNNDWSCHGNQWQILKFDVEEEIITSGNVPIQNVFASSSTGDSSPQDAIDGSLNSIWASYGNGEWITLDLGSSQSVSRVDIAFYLGNTRHADFAIALSENNIDWTEVYVGRSGGSSLGLESFTFPTIASRYVRIIGYGNDDATVTSRPYNSYAEVEVYATGVVPPPIIDAPVEVLLFEDFEDDPLGDYACADWSRDWNKPYTIWCDPNNPNRERYYPTLWNMKIIQGDAANPSQVLEAIYPQMLDGGTGGNGWGSPLGDSYEELYMTFKVKFKEGFEPKRGGKLHGLTGGSCLGGCQGVCHDGFSSRYIFWGDGGFTPYLYFPEQVNQCGTNCRLRDEFCVYEDIASRDEKFMFNQGEWHELTMRVVMNDPGVANGILESFVDGKLSQQKTDVLYREVGKTYGIDEFYFITFFGGGTDCLTNDPDEACDAPNSKDEYTYFDDFRVWRYMEGAQGVPVGLTPHALDAVIVPPQ